MSVPREAGGGSQRTADRLAITELLYRYAELIDAGDFDGVGAAAVAGDVRRRFLAPTPSRSCSRPRPAGSRTPAHRRPGTWCSTRSSSWHGDGTATARSTFCVVQATETVPLQPIVVGRYFDSFSCDPDVPAGWYFTARQVDVEMIGDVSAHLMIDPRQFDR